MTRHKVRVLGLIVPPSLDMSVRKMSVRGGSPVRLNVEYQANGLAGSEFEARNVFFAVVVEFGMKKTYL